ncbi:hypothetical protein LSAT2_005248 [Lamellibrachia satsuma]|nr:hypothetical protein LSAT2_005248 [Lamellibrachia satsuma]
MTWRRRTCREDGSRGRTVVHGEIAEQTQAVSRQLGVCHIPDTGAKHIHSAAVNLPILSFFNLRANHISPGVVKELKTRGRAGLDVV